MHIESGLMSHLNKQQHIQGTCCCICVHRQEGLCTLVLINAQDTFSKDRAGLSTGPETGLDPAQQREIADGPPPAERSAREDSNLLKLRDNVSGCTAA